LANRLCIAFIDDNEVNKLFASSFCNSRASLKGLSHRRIPNIFCPNAASSRFDAEDFYATSEEFFPGTTDFFGLNISAFIASNDGNYGPGLT